jgi:hypothetical protein
MMDFRQKLNKASDYLFVTSYVVSLRKLTFSRFFYNQPLISTLKLNHTGSFFLGYRFPSLQFRNYDHKVTLKDIPFPCIVII